MAIVRVITLQPGGTARVCAIAYPDGWLIRWVWATRAGIPHTGYPGRGAQFAESLVVWN